MIEFRSLVHNDLNAIKKLLDGIDLFPSEMLKDMTSDYLNNKESSDLWYVGECNEELCGMAYCVEETLTASTYNLLAIGISADKQGQGIGTQMMAYIEKNLKSKGARLLIVDTSGKDEFTQVRSFYENLEYDKEAVIRDFWDDGDDKVTYRKRLNE